MCSGICPHEEMIHFQAKYPLPPGLQDPNTRRAHPSKPPRPLPRKTVFPPPCWHTRSPLRLRGRQGVQRFRPCCKCSRRFSRSTFTLLTTMRPALPAPKPPVPDRTTLADLCARMQARVGSGAPQSRPWDGSFRPVK